MTHHDQWVQHFPSPTRAVWSAAQPRSPRGDAGGAVQQPGLCLRTGLAGHSGELFSEGRISAAALCSWDTTVTTHVAHSFSLSTNIPQKGGGGGEVWSPGEIKLSFSRDIKLSVKPSVWKWRY